MSIKPKTGGPAFPEIRIIDGDNYNAPRRCYYPGQTLRDYFAAKALAGLLAHQYSGMLKPGVIADLAYKLADAMLEARVSPKDPEKKEGGAA